VSIFSHIWDRRHHNSTFFYNLGVILQYMVPNFLFRHSLKSSLATIRNYDEENIFDRVNYYNKLDHSFLPDQNFFSLKDFKLSKIKLYKPTTHFFDTYRYTRYFEKKLKIACLFGDNRVTPQIPTIVKSRPLNFDNSNAILLKLNTIRHFMFVNDRTKFANKRNMLVGRTTLHFENRVRFFERYFGHSLCDLGQVQRKNTNPLWKKPYMTIDEQLRYKFILALEGYDVASNLKWVMSSNSLAVMTKPKYETWYMEGRLVPDYHYVEISDDFSDLEDKLHYYIQNIEAANNIICNAHTYINQFTDLHKEQLIALLVLKKYFDFLDEE